MPRPIPHGGVAVRLLVFLALVPGWTVPAAGADFRAGGAALPWSAPPGLAGVEQTATRLLVEYDPARAGPGPLHMPLVLPGGSRAEARWLSTAEGGALSIERLGYLRFDRLARLTIVPPPGIDAPRHFEVRFVADDRPDADPETTPPERSSFPLESPVVSWRLQVPSTDVWSVSYADLAAEGFPAGVPVTSLVLVDRSTRDRGGVVTERPVPIVVEEGEGSAGVFDDGDRVLFYGLDRRDRYRPAPAEERYGRHHNYWLRAGDGGARMPEVRTLPMAGETTPEAFIDVVRITVGDTLACWCDDDPGPRPHVYARHTDLLGVAEFFIRGGGCVEAQDPAIPGNSDFCGEVFADGVKMQEFGIVSPDVADAMGRRAVDTPHPWDPAGTCGSGLADAVAFTPSIASSTYDWCADINCDDAVTISDAVTLTPFLSGSIGCAGDAGP